MNLVDAAARFNRTLEHCTNLEELHRSFGGSDRGRRRIAPSANGAIIVLALGAWQSAIEDMTLAILGEPLPGSPLPPHENLLAGSVRNAVNKFSTPDSIKTRDLMLMVNFNPWNCWTWRQPGGRGVGHVEFDSTRARASLDEWLAVRHSVAHGEDGPPQVAVLEAVRTNAADPTIRLKDAVACVSFVRRLAALTSDGVAIQFGFENGVWV